MLRPRKPLAKWPIVLVPIVAVSLCFGPANLPVRVWNDDPDPTSGTWQVRKLRGDVIEEGNFSATGLSYGMAAGSVSMRAGDYNFSAATHEGKSHFQIQNVARNPYDWQIVIRQGNVSFRFTHGD